MLTFERANEPFKYEPETGLPVGKATAGNDGYLRVRADKRGVKKYCAEIKVNRVKKFPGYSDTSDEAAAARGEAELKYGFRSNRGTNKAAYVKKR